MTPDSDKTLAEWLTERPAPPPAAEPAREIDDAISMEARQVNGITVPAEGALTEQQRGQIRKAALAHIDESGIPFKDVAKQIGRSASVVSEILRDKYVGDVDAVLRLLNGWMDDDIRRRRNRRPIGFFSHQVFREIATLARYIKGNARTSSTGSKVGDRPRIALAFGPSGIGKTVAGEALAMEDRRTIYVRLESRASGAAKLAELILAAQREPAVGRLLQRTVELLTNTGWLLVIDEIDLAGFSALEFIRTLADKAGIPILLLGTPDFYERIRSMRSGKGSKRYDQFTRRVGYVRDLVRGEDGLGGDKRPIYSREEIVAIFQQGGVRLTSEAIDELQAMACCLFKGTLGFACNVFDLALRAARSRGLAVIDVAMLRKAAKRTLSPSGDHGADEFLDQIDGERERIQKMPRRQAAAG